MKINVCLLYCVVAKKDWE